jgi:AcrR family transcriptional regulator
MIVDAVIPLITERGADITSKQIAEAAGVAEGTIFRAFGDKESLIEAAAEKFFDPETALDRLRGIDPDDPLPVKIGQLIEQLRGRFNGALRVMTAVGRKQTPRPPDPEVYNQILTQIFAPDVERLTLPPRRIAHLVRLLTFASSVPPVNDADTPFTTEELTELVLNGIQTHPTPQKEARPA